jgi:aryl-alcohol dehydrogenase-like predicted oxidoreductase
MIVSDSGADRDEARAIFDACTERSGNFIDTANGYTGGTAERMVGEFAGVLPAYLGRRHPGRGGAARDGPPRPGGKVLYIAISDIPAWQVSRMQAIAELRGWAPPIALQVPYNLVEGPWSATSSRWPPPWGWAWWPRTAAS